ncbi:MAG: NAD(P)-binding protein [Prevotella sp.]|nr:NAD(P)-binding protein [Prevotella sp.]
MAQRYDYLIVGSGLFGATFAYKARQAGKRCLVIDKRPHLGGNVYCEDIEGIHVHKYGAHIFHTSNKEVWDLVNSIVPFNRYTNCPVANYEGRLYNLPFNMNTFYQMWGVRTPEEAKAKIDAQIKQAVEEINKQHAEKGLPPIVPSPKGGGWEGASNLEEQALMLIGKDIYERLIKGYTEKQWGRRCTDLPAFIIKRLPVRFVFDNNYFNDSYQGIPIGGYNCLIDGLLKGVDTLTDIDFYDCQRTYDEKCKSWNVQCSMFNVQCSKIVYTGQIDEFFDFRFGKLNFRTVRFEQEIHDTPNFQGNAVVNYTEAQVPYTRIIEHKHFEMFGQAVYDVPRTIISKEFSTEWQPGMEPYYPVNDDRNNALADAYRNLAAQEPNVIFGGRLAEYKYYDMAPIIEKVLAMEI